MDNSSSGKTSLWKIIGGIMAVMVLGFLVLMFWGTGDYNKEGDAVIAKTQQILSQFKNGQIADLYKDADEELKKVTPEKDIENLVTVFPILKTYASFATTKVTHDSKNAEVMGTLKDASGKEYAFTMKLSGTDNVWKFYAFDVAGDVASSDENLGKEDTSAIIKTLTIGDTLNNEGATIAKQGSFATDTPIIYVSVDTDQAVEKISASIKFIYTATGDESPSLNLPVYKAKSQNYVRTSFHLTKPTAGWAKGDYKVIAKLASGNIKEGTFVVK